MHFCLEIQGWPVHGTVMLLFAYSAFSIFAFLGGRHICSGNSLQHATRGLGLYDHPPARVSLGGLSAAI